MTVFYRSLSRIGQIQLHGKARKDDEANQRKSPSKTRNAIRKIDTIEYEDIPKNCKKKWYIVDCENIFTERELKEVIIE